MESGDPGSTRSGGAEKRAYARLPLRLEAELTGTGVRGRTGEMRDFCMGGVFFACETSERERRAPEETLHDRDGHVELRFSVADEAGRRHGYRLTARVARVFEHGIGLAFLNPDPRTLQVLQRAAVEYQESGTGDLAEVAASAKIEGGERERILGICANLVTEHVGALMHRFFQAGEEGLLVAARETRSSSRQTQLFDAGNQLKNGQGTIQDAYRDLIQTHLANLGEPLEAVEEAPTNMSQSSLSLVDKDEFEDFLTIAEMVSKAEPRHEVVLFELCRRFSRLGEHAINNENNPIGPVAIFNAYRTAIRALSFEPVALAVLHDAFEGAAGEHLEQFYAAVNTALEQNGVDLAREPAPAPVVVGSRGTRSPRSAPPRREPSPPPAPQPAPRAGSFDDGVAPAGGGGASRDFRDYHGAAEDLVPGPPGAPRPAAADGEAATDAAPGAGPAARPTAFSAAKTLLGLKRRADRTAVRRVAGGAAVAAQEPAPDEAVPIAEEEIAGAVARLDFNRLALPEGTDASQELTARLLEALADGRTGGVPGALPEQARDTLDLVGSLFEAMLGDPDLPENLRPRVARLEPCVQKLALSGTGFFEDPEFPARKLLNRIGEIETYGEADAESYLQRTLDPVIDRVVAAHDRDPGVFATELSGIEGLVDAQTRDYEANVARVVQSCEDQQAFVKARQTADGTAKPRREPGKSTGTSKEWLVWLERAESLEPGDMMELDDGAGKTQRVTLAWIGEDFNPFVFVNPKGQKDASLSLQELAMQLRRGLAVMLEKADQPLVERALYSVLHNIHGRLEFQATHDSATGLANRRIFERQVGRALTKAVQEREEHALCYVAFDRLTSVSNESGYEAGEALLKHIAGLLEEHAGPDAILANLGTEAFGILLEQNTAKVALGRARELRDTFREHPFRWHDETYPLAASIGVMPVTYETESHLTAISGAERAADAARDGDGVHLYEPSARERTDRPTMVDWVTLINRTLREDRVQLRRQRIVPLQGDSGAKPQFEILLGLRDEKGEPVSPNEFINAVAHYDQMPALDRWVVRNALKWMTDNRTEVRGADCYAIKLTGHSLREEHLMEFILEQLTESAVPPGKVCFGLTEEDAVENLTQAGQLIRTMKEFGCRFSLNNFGSGHHSYTYLKDLPVDYVKVDGRFVEHMLEDPDDEAVVSSVNEIAHVTGIMTIAEYVQGEEILERLRDLGVDFAQGFHVEKPTYLEAAPPAGARSSPGSGRAEGDGRSAPRPDDGEHTLKF